MQHSLTTQQNSFRLWLLTASFAVGFALLLFRIVDLQVARSGEFKALADANRFATRFLPKERGVFLDRYGEQLVSNVPKYFRSNARGVQLDQQFLGADEVLPLLATQTAQVGYRLDRRYVYPESLAHVLGYVGAPTAEELLANRAIRLNDTIGKTGLERKLDEQLQGTAERMLFEVNALGEPLKVLQNTPGIPGATIATTLDPYLSEIAFQALGDQRGVVIITDVRTGEILSLVSSPSYSATVMSEQKVNSNEEAERKGLVQSYFTHPQKLFFNRAVSGMYPPGSVFKIVTALAGLEKGSVDETTSVQDEGVLTVGDYSYANWFFTQYGRTEGAISLERALSRSNDIYFYKVAEWVGPTYLADFARMFGFGKATNIELDGEAIGTVPDPVWKEQVIGEPWFLGNTYHFGIGQGDVLVTPLQIAQMTQIMGNAGRVCTPHVLVQNTLSNDTATTCGELGVSEKNMELVLQGMIDACSSGGTAFPFFEFNESRIQKELSAYDQLERGAVACKTGTAEFGAADGRGYRPTHGWFIAIVSLPQNLVGETTALNASASASVSAELAASKPGGKTWSELRTNWLAHAAEFPRNVGITVLVESDEAQLYKEGSRDAAPIARAVLEWMLGEAVGPPKSRDAVTEGE